MVVKRGLSHLAGLVVVVSVVLTMAVACGRTSGASDSSWPRVVARPFEVECGLSGQTAGAHRIEIDGRRWETMDGISGLQPGVEYEGSFQLTYSPRFEMNPPYDGTRGEFAADDLEIQFGGGHVGCE